MAKDANPYRTLKKLLDADAGLATADFDVLSGVTAAADELNLLDGLSVAGNATASNGAQGAAGKYLSADAVGEWVRLLCVKAGQWQVAGYAGTWTVEG